MDGYYLPLGESTMMRLYHAFALFPFAVISCWWISYARGDLIVDVMGETVIEDFSSFTGGFAPSPSASQLDSDSWRVTGFDEGLFSWGDDKTAAGTDFNRGEKEDGGVNEGGVWAFQIAGNTILGIQPTTADFTEGTIELRVLNETGTTVPNWDLSYDIFYRNDQNRANSFDFSYSTDGSAYTDLPPLDFISPEAKDDSPSFASVSRSTSISASVDNGDYLYLKWAGDDVSGSYNRDEFGLDNVSITPNPEPGMLLMGAVTSLAFLAYGVARRRAARRRRE